MGAAAVFERGDCVDELCNARTVQRTIFYQRMLNRCSFASFYVVLGPWLGCQKKNNSHITAADC
jgi:hypothetical protein